jgi:hypothetical protein
MGGFNIFVNRPQFIPQVLPTAQSLAGLLCCHNSAARSAAIRSGFAYIERARHNNGDEGWEYFAELGGKTITEIAAWVLIAQCKSLRAGIWVTSEERATVTTRIARDVDLLLARQAPSGGWCPIDVIRENNVRSYSTIMALWCLAEVKATLPPSDARIDAAILNTVSFLLLTFRKDVGWSTKPSETANRRRNYGLIAQTLCTLGWLDVLGCMVPFGGEPALQDAKQLLLSDESLAVKEYDDCESTQPTDPFLEDSGGFTVPYTWFLWCPWTLAAAHLLSIDTSICESSRLKSRQLADVLLHKLFIHEMNHNIESKGLFIYHYAECMICINELLRRPGRLVP